MQKTTYKTMLLGAVMLLPFMAYGQNSNAVFFTDAGERFTLIINGIRYNDQPGTNIRAEGLKGEFFKVKIIFEDNSLGETDFNLTLEPGMETTTVIKKNNKGKYVGRYMGSVPVAESNYEPPVQQVQAPSPSSAPQGAVTQTVTTTTTTTGAQSPSTGVSIGINVNEETGNMNMNMNMTGFDNEGMSTTQSTTVTTTTVTSGQNNAPPEDEYYSDPRPAAYQLPGYTGPVGCPVPVSESQFNTMKSSIGSKSFEDSKLTIAKQILNNSCLLSSQVKEIMLMFNFEETRLDFAKFAYGRTYDIGNYFVVNDAFTFESSIDELGDYINSR
jgi:hypothetical protein